jgi:hypothetical protein
MRGPGYPNTKLCLNETDFHTMDLLCKIPREEFFSYQDSAGFIYGFNVFSLMDMFKRNRKIVNPYNREDVPIPIVCRVFSVYKKILLLYPLTCNLTRFENKVDHDAQTLRSELRMREDVVVDDVVDEVVDDVDDEVSSVTFASNNSERRTVEEEDGQNVAARFNHLQEFYSVLERISLVFERIKELTGYEYDPCWFSNLTKSDYDKFYHFYWVFWSRSNENECRLIYPFDDAFYALPLFNKPASDVFYKHACLELIERMVYSGVDEVWQRKGAEQVITVIHIVILSKQNIYSEIANIAHNLAK